LPIESIKESDVPATLSFPGVYVEELPSGVRTVVGVATSIAAFVGAAERGPIDTQVVVNSYAEFERTFGGLWEGSKLAFAVRSFYQNGGSQAVIVRVFGPDNAVPSKIVADTLALEAAYPGAWGDKLRVRIDTDVDASVKDTAFNLTVRDMAQGGATEMFRSLTMTHGPRSVDKVLMNQSVLVRVTGDPSAVARPKGNKDPKAGVDIWADDDASTKVSTPATAAQALTQKSFDGNDAGKKGIYALRDADLFNMLCIPPYTAAGGIDLGLVATAAAFCKERRALLLVDPDPNWKTAAAAITGVATLPTIADKSYAAVFFPRLSQPNPLHDNQVEDFAPCGAVAGVFARTDTTRGVWKAPAGLDAALGGVLKFSTALIDGDVGLLNPRAINSLRNMPGAGGVIWGSRTMDGDDRLSSQWKYIPVRRTALFIEESLYRSTQWVVFEPNDEPLWAQIRLSIGAFMHDLYRQGAFQGTTPQQAYYVKCDKDTTTQNDINLGIVNIVVGFAPLKPAEFVVLQLQQMAGQIDV
jgi:phage tail sheath protein FI